MAKEVLVVGAGFGGLEAGRALARDRGVRVTVVDQRNHHLFQPLLYQVATAGLNPADIAVPIRAQFSRAPNAEVRLGRVASVDLGRKRISLEDGTELGWDFLVLAGGAQHSYFGHPEWAEFAPGLKTLEQATEIRRRLLSAFESAEHEQDPAAQGRLLTFVIVGGGPTGVELAGAIADISRTVLVRDFRKIDPASARVLLLEAGPRILPAPAAIQEGKAAARNILASIGGRPRRPFRYRDKGMMATIGKHKAIAQTGPIRLTGYLAWLAWLFIHILYLIGFKNRLSVFAQWVWSYVFSKRGARLITNRDWRLPS